MPADTAFATDMADHLRHALREGRAPRLHGLVVLRDGRQVLEHYGAGDDFKWREPLGSVTFRRDTLHDIRSVTKSITGLLYGIALAGGEVPQPRDGLLRHFPEYPDLAADPRRARLRVEHALTMTLGIEWKEDVPYTSPANSEIAMELAPDRYRFILERPVVDQPGRRWSYSGGASALIGHLIERGTGKTLPEFARDALFRPLGIEAFEWIAGADGVASSASGLRLAPQDLASIGQMVLDGGRSQGHEVVPPEWLKVTLRPHVRIAEAFDYGYQWYIGLASAASGHGLLKWVGGMGNGGQRLFLVPDLHLVVAMTAGDYDGPDQAATPSTIIDEVVLKAIER